MIQTRDIKIHTCDENIYAWDNYMHSVDENYMHIVYCRKIFMLATKTPINFKKKLIIVADILTCDENIHSSYECFLWQACIFLLQEWKDSRL